MNQHVTEDSRVAATKTKRGWLFVLPPVVLGLLLLSPGLIRRWQRGEDALAQARESGVIRIGYAVEAPYAFLTSEGRVTGESPEIARVIGSEEHRRLVQAFGFTEAELPPSSALPEGSSPR